MEFLGKSVVGLLVEYLNTSLSDTPFKYVCETNVILYKEQYLTTLLPMSELEFEIYVGLESGRLRLNLQNPKACESLKLALKGRIEAIERRLNGNTTK